MSFFILKYIQSNKLLVSGWCRKTCTCISCCFYLKLLWAITTNITCCQKRKDKFVTLHLLSALACGEFHNWLKHFTSYFKASHILAAPYLSDLFRQYETIRPLRSSFLLVSPRFKSKVGEEAFGFYSLSSWNNLPDCIRCAPLFKSRLKTFLFSCALE